MGLLDFMKRKQPDPVLERDRADLLRHYEILADCQELVNTSTNFETVLRRCDRLLDELFYFYSWETHQGLDDLERHGIKFKTPPSVLWENARAKAPAVLCAAVDRALDAEIDAALKLKTVRGQEARMCAFVDKIQALDGVPVDVLKYVGSLPVLDALREPAVIVTCKSCGHKFHARPHAHKGYLLDCPKCDQHLHVDTSKK